MTQSRPKFDQVNLVVKDMDATLEFYRRLGLKVPDAPDWPPGSGARHGEAVMAGGVQLEFDNEKMARIWHAGRRAGSTGSPAVLGFHLPTREAVDERYAEITAAGYVGVNPPHDAFWGARYAIVQDPDGNDVGLMSPIDPAKRFVPE